MRKTFATKNAKRFFRCFLFLFFIFPFLAYGENAPTYELDSLAFMSEKVFLGRIITPPGMAVEKHIATVSIEVPIWPPESSILEIPVSLYAYGASLELEFKPLPKGWWEAQSFAFFVRRTSHTVASLTFFDPVPSGILLKIEDVWTHPIQFFNPGGGYWLTATRTTGFPETKCDLKTYIPERMKVIQGYKKMILEPDEKQRKHNLFSILFERLSGEPKPYEDYILDKVCKKIARLDRISRVEGTFTLKVFGFYLAHFSASIPNSSSYEWRYVIFGEGSVSDED